MSSSKEKGFATGPVLSWVGKELIDQVTTAGYLPYLVGAYQLPQVIASTNAEITAGPSAACSAG